MSVYGYAPVTSPALTPRCTTQVVMRFWLPGRSFPIPKPGSALAANPSRPFSRREGLPDWSDPHNHPNTQSNESSAIISAGVSEEVDSDAKASTPIAIPMPRRSSRNPCPGNSDQDGIRKVFAKSRSCQSPYMPTSVTASRKVALRFGSRTSMCENKPRSSSESYIL